uniref:Uncharacterized protein n=1 Tax=Caenorhabditis japonica TaxID=281687 RepID=A0A8R1DVS1_CAEJA
FIFVDEDFRRPFFTVYVKSCTLIVYMIRYLLFEAKNDGASYQVLVNDNSIDSDTFELTCESLALEGYESVTDVESDVDVDIEEVKRKRTIRFADRKEVLANLTVIIIG